MHRLLNLFPGIKSHRTLLFPRGFVEEFPPLHAEASLGRLGCLAPNMVVPTRTFVLLIKIYQNTFEKNIVLEFF